MPTELELRAITATSPSLAETMRLCFLKAAFDRTKNAAQYSVGSPKAWLGNAYHEVLEALTKYHVGDLSEPIDPAIMKLWDTAIEAQLQKVLAHPLNNRFGVPASWPGYYVARASVILRGRELIGARQHRSPVDRPARDSIQNEVRIAEKRLEACSGKLVGRPDLIQAGEVVDYKTGSLVEWDDQSSSERAKPSYIRQLKIYGYLVKENFGWWPRRGLLSPLGGTPISIELDPDECTTEALGAVALLDEFNTQLSAHPKLGDFASPSPTACKWCAHKIICSPFWQASGNSWASPAEGLSIEGILLEIPRPVLENQAFALTVRTGAGSKESGVLHVSPFNRLIHPKVEHLTAGERVRIVALRSRPDGSLVPTDRTVLMSEQSLPGVAFG